MRDESFFMGSTMKKFIFLDLDDTIFDFHLAERIALERTLTEMGANPTDEMMRRYSAINRSCWEALERGEMTRAEVLVHRYELLFLEYGLSCDANATQAKYEAYLSIGHHFIDGAERLLDGLRARGYRLFLASNGTAKVQHGRIASSGIAPYFERMFISQEVGYDKPSPMFFERAFAEIVDFDKSEALIVGDSLTSDIQGGINAGIETVWFNPKGLPTNNGIIPDHIITHLSELIPLIERLS